MSTKKQTISVSIHEWSHEDILTREMTRQIAIEIDKWIMEDLMKLVNTND